MLSVSQTSYKLIAQERKYHCWYKLTWLGTRPPTFFFFFLILGKNGGYNIVESL